MIGLLDKFVSEQSYSGSVADDEYRSASIAREIIAELYLSESVSQVTIPIGTVMAFVVDPGDGWLPCIDNPPYDRVLFQDLYDVLPDVYIVDADHFTLPNLSGRTIIGDTDGYTIGQEGGEKTHQLSVIEMPEHSHGIGYERIGVAGTNRNVLRSIASATGFTPTKSEGSGSSHNNMQPYAVLSYWIKT